MQPLRFILQAIDPDYGHPAFEAMFVVDQADELRSLLGIDVKVDPDFERFYRLEPHEVEALTRHFRLAFDPEGRETTLTKWSLSRHEPPYLVHGGYELVLMIDGRKPFARMHGGFYPPVCFKGEDLFDRYVAQGLLHKEEELDKLTEPTRLEDGRIVEGFRTVYYTRKSEEWRIPAWKFISQASRKTGWNAHFERLEGMLFGYEDWQNDWWIEELRKSKYQFGTLLIYLAVTEAELAAIEEAGHRALPPRTSSLKLVSSTGEDADDEEPRRLMKADGAVALLRFRVKARPFLVDLVTEKQERLHELPPARINDLNLLILDGIEIVMRLDTAAR